MHSFNSLYQEAERLDTQIRMQIGLIYRENNLDPQSETDRMMALALKDRHGNFIMAPLLAARADCLSAMVMSKVGGTKIRNS